LESSHKTDADTPEIPHAPTLTVTADRLLAAG